MTKLNKTTKVTTGWIHQRSVRKVFALMAARRPTRPSGSCPPPAAVALLWTDIGPAFSCCPHRCGSYASTTYARRWPRSQPRRCGIRHSVHGRLRHSLHGRLRHSPHGRPRRSDEGDSVDSSEIHLCADQNLAAPHRYRFSVARDLLL